MSEFVEFLNEAFREFGTISHRRMFGGYGIYHDGVMIGLVADDSLYLKVDPKTEHYFVERDCERFSYPKGEKLVQMSYYLAPEEVFDDPSEMCVWAERAYEAALRSKK